MIIVLQMIVVLILISIFIRIVIGIITRPHLEAALQAARDIV